MQTPPRSGPKTPCPWSRRQFLGTGLAAAAPWPLNALAADDEEDATPVALAPAPPDFPRAVRSQARVAVVRCSQYGPDLHAALARSLDLPLLFKGDDLKLQAHYLRADVPGADQDEGKAIVRMQVVF